MNNLQKGIPITVGIIGHLDAIITDEHQQLIETLFEDLQREYPNSPVSLFSQLAKGADTVIAELFLKLKERHNRNYHLFVPLPFQKEKFSSVFNHEEKAKFDSLISRSARSFILEQEENLSDNELYRSGGQFVSDSSVILIAIWDNECNEKRGGTADIVKYKVEGTFEKDNVGNIFDIKGALLSLSCNRISDIKAKKITYPDTPLLVLIKQNASIRKALEKIESLNFSYKSVGKSVLIASANYLYPLEKPLNKISESLKEYYAIIDSQAIASQRKSNSATKILFIIGFLIISSFECYKHHLPGPEIFSNLSVLILTIILIISAYLIFQFSHRKKIHASFLENRILAEALRIQFFWDLSHLRKSVSKYILRIHSAEFSWIRHIILALNGVTFDYGDNNQRREEVKNFWLINQYDYFRNKIDSAERMEKILLRLSGISFWIAALLIFSLLFFEHSIEEHHLKDIVIVVIGIFFGLFALARGYVYKKGYEQTINQYSLMKDIYFATLQKIAEIENDDSLPDPIKNEKINELYYLAGKEALIEHGNWFLVFKDRQPEVEGIGG
ncbi:MAG: hypothetical protein ABI687_03065 [Flavitalea sp.]